MPQSEVIPTLVAPRWHTAVTILLLFGLSALGARSHNISFVGRSHGHIPGYLGAVGMEWFLVGFVWFGLRLRGFRLLDMLGDRKTSVLAALRTLGIGLAFLFVSNIVLAVLARILRASPNRHVRSILPHGGPEIAVYLLLALTAGFCEEVVCRGYLQKQFAALTGSATLAIVLQGVVFGAAHGYQGFKYMILLAVFGCLFGVLAYWRRSLLPGMVAHFLQDGLVGLLAGLATN